MPFDWNISKWSELKLAKHQKTYMVRFARSVQQGQCDNFNGYVFTDPSTFSGPSDAEPCLAFHRINRYGCLILFSSIPTSPFTIPGRVSRIYFVSIRDAGTNGPRTFWRWLDRQVWRKMFPKPSYVPWIYIALHECVKKAVSPNRELQWCSFTSCKSAMAITPCMEVYPHL